MILGIVIGRSSDTTTRKYLKKIPKNLLNDNKSPPADIAVAWYIKKNYPNIEIDIITPSEISLQRFNKCDFVYIMYDLIDAYNEGGIELFKERKKIYSKTNSIMYPTVDMQKFIISKSKYYKFLLDNGISVAPFMSIPKNAYMEQTITKKKKLINTLIKKIHKKQWPGVIIKPELGSYGTGIKIFTDISKLTSIKLFKLLEKSFEKKNFEAMLFQRYMEDFKSFYEIRTYWINGKYIRSVGTIIEYKTLGTGEEELYIDSPKNEGGDIPLSIISELIINGEKIIKSLPKMYNSENLLLRLDFGCCQHMDDTLKGVQPDMCRKYFLNEIELTGNLFPDVYPKIDIVKILGDALVQKALELTKKYL